jgi:hypothetical protein
LSPPLLFLYRYFFDNYSQDYGHMQEHYSAN